MIQIDRIRKTMIGTIGLLCPSAVALWAPSKYPMRALGDAVITARIARGPTLRPIDVYFSDEPVELTWTVTAPAAHDRCGVSIAGHRWYVDAGATPTATTVRNALLALFVARDLPDVTITSSGAGSISFVADDSAPGLLWGPRALGQHCAVEVEESAECEVSTATAEIEIELQAYATGRGAEAHELLGTVFGGLRSDDVVTLRGDYGVSLVRAATTPIDLTTLAGADWQSRAAQRLTVSVRSYTARAVSVVDEVSEVALEFDL